MKKNNMHPGDLLCDNHPTRKHIDEMDFDDQCLLETRKIHLDICNFAHFVSEMRIISTWTTNNQYLLNLSYSDNSNEEEFNAR